MKLVSHNNPKIPPILVISQDIWNRIYDESPASCRLMTEGSERLGQIGIMSMACHVVLEEHEEHALKRISESSTDPPTTYQNC